MSKLIKGRDWAFVFYPEDKNCPKNWYDLLNETHVPMALSPFHNKDVNPDGTEKKPHIHVLIRYDGPTTNTCIKRISDLVNGTNVIKVDSARGMYRYHTHIDNPEKYQYDEKERLLLNGFDCSNLDKFTEMEMDKYENEILHFIIDNDINEYYILLRELLENNLMNLHYVAKKRTIMINSFIKSKKYYEEHLVKTGKK